MEKSRTPCLALALGKGLGTVRTTLPIIVGLSEEKKTRICRNERAEADPSTHLKKGKAALAQTWMSLDVMRQSAEGMSSFVAMFG